MSNARSRVLQVLDPRREPFWWGLFLLSLVLRVLSVLMYRNPSDAIFSDASRHWDNAKHFLDPGPMGCSNPYFYQLYLWLLQQVTHENKLAMGIVTAALSVSYPVAWYLFAVNVMQRKVNALRAVTVLSLLPTHVSMFTFFMNETVLGPVLGAALWATVKASRQRSGRWFLLAVTFWVIAILTRSIVLPIGMICLAWALWRQRPSWAGEGPAPSPWSRLRQALLRQRRRALLTLGAGAITAVGFGAAAQHAYKHLHRYTPFGDNINVAIYFASAAHDYQVTYVKRATYFYSSPSLYVSPFDPFYRFKSARKGKFAFELDPEKKGADVQEIFKKQYRKNLSKMPRMVYENLVFLAFGHSWPDAGKDNIVGRICLHERWIWLPITLYAFFKSLVYIKRRGPALVPILTVLFTLLLYVASLSAMMEGRYRKPLEPLLIVAVFWLIDARKPKPAFQVS